MAFKILNIMRLTVFLERVETREAGPVIARAYCLQREGLEEGNPSIAHWTPKAEKMGLKVQVIKEARVCRRESWK